MAESNGDWIRRTARLTITVMAIILFGILSYFVVSRDLPEGIIGVVGGALAHIADWVKTAFNFFFGKQSQSEDEE